tara:strand:+ start:154 stop:645 length:492 start_codon:yes stop_codon:yes gene_type:complete
MKNIYYILTIIFAVILYGEEKYSNAIPHYVWESDSSNIGQTEIWFQDWTDYTRLFIKSIKDTSSVEKHPYAKTDYEEEYKNAKEYKKPNYVQLLGNIQWTKPQNWSDNNVNTFKWYVDRDQNWIHTNKTLFGEAKISQNKLHLTIKDYNNVIIDVISRYRKYK